MEETDARAGYRSIDYKALVRRVAPFDGVVSDQIGGTVSKSIIVRKGLKYFVGYDWENRKQENDDHADRSGGQGVYFTGGVAGLADKVLSSSNPKEADCQDDGNWRQRGE